MTFAAYKTSLDWIALSSIRSNELAVLDWIVENYVGGLSDWQIIPVEIRRVHKKRRKK